MTCRQYVLDSDFLMLRKHHSDALSAVIERIKQARKHNHELWKEMPVLTSLSEAFELFGFEAVTDEDDDICSIDSLSDCQDPNQMLLFESIVPFVEPCSYITVLETDKNFWQWFFDNNGPRAH